jgi:hypothetical protein
MSRVAELENVISTLEDRLGKSEEQNWTLIQERNQTKVAVSRIMEALPPDPEHLDPSQTVLEETSCELGDVAHYSTASHTLEYAKSIQDLRVMLGTPDDLDPLEEPSIEIPMDHQPLVSTQSLARLDTRHGSVDHSTARIWSPKAGDLKFEDIEEDEIQKLHEFVSLLARPVQHHFPDHEWAMLPPISTQESRSTQQFSTQSVKRSN